MTTTTTTTTVSLVSLEKALVTMKKSYDKANSKVLDLETEAGVKAKASKDAILSAQENVVLAMIKNNYTVSIDAKAYYDLVLERTDVSKADAFPVLDHEGKVLDFLHELSVKMCENRSVIVRFWNMTKRVLSLSWYYTGRYVVNGLVYVWNKTCDLWTWIKSKFSKKEATVEVPVMASVTSVTETATPVATPVVEAAPEAAEAVVEVVETPVVEAIVEEVTSEEIPVISEELLAQVEGDLVINSVEELDTFIRGDVVDIYEDEATEIVVATQSDEVSPLEIFEVIDEVTVEVSATEVTTEEVVTEVVATEVAVVETAEVSVATVVADAIPAALTAGAPAPKAPNTKVKVSRPNASKPKATKTKKV